MITGPLCHAARALVELSRANLSRISGVDEEVIRQFEEKVATPDDATIDRLQTALEEYGAIFIPEDRRGAGVRLKFTRAYAEQIATLEDEGGPIRHDDVP